MVISNRVRLLISVFLVVLVILFFLLSKLVVRRDSATTLDLAKISMLLNIPDDDVFEIGYFQFKYNNFGIDPVSHCAIRLDGLSSTALGRIQKEFESFGPESFPYTSLFLSERLLDTLKEKGLDSGYRTTATVTRAWESESKVKIWRKQCTFLIFLDPDTSGTLFVSADGDIFLDDALVEVYKEIQP